MKRKAAAICLLASLLAMALTGCSNGPVNTPAGNDQEETDYLQLYDGVLQEYYEVISNPDLDYDVDSGKYGVAEAAMEIGDQALSTIGYLLEDINGDEIPELLIGVSGKDDGAYTKNDLYALYTLKDSKPSFVLEGRSRNAYALMEDGKIYNGGSNGAIYRIFGTYQLSTDGKLFCREFYFSYEKDESFEDIGFYYNTTGQYDKAYAKELDISEDEFWQKEDDFAGQTVKLDFTPFANLEKTEQPNKTEPEPQQRIDAASLCGKWICNAQAGDGSRYVLFVDILTDGSAAYRCGPPESEILVDYRGSWKFDNESEIITFNLTDVYEGDNFVGGFKVAPGGQTLSLTHHSGVSFLFGTEGQTFAFSANN